MLPYLENLKAFLARLAPGQKLALGIVLVGGIGLLSAVGYWAGRPDYALLFGNLETADANKVVEALRADQITFEIRDGGSAIYVPQDQVYELRLRFAGEGVVSEGPMGYELFDQGTLGMTDFMQKLNLKRALEGELARTISSIRQVDVARVHLVIPERSPFRDAQHNPTASVVLQLAGTGRLSPDQIDGITSLVAGAVEGLSPSDVTILDTRGNMLSNPHASDESARFTSTQLEYQRAIETHLTEKGQSMLDQIVGPGNAIVRVSAAIDFDRSVTEQNLIDPESATVIAEETQEASQAEDQTTASVKNYEISRTVERKEKSVGAVSNLTVSVILNAKQVPAEGAEEATPPQVVMYPEAELQEIESLVKNAVGFQDDRGDRFAIHQTRFDTSVDEQIATEIREQRENEQLELYLRYGLMVLALVLAIWLIRSAARRVGTETRGAAGSTAELGAGARSTGQHALGGGGARELAAGASADEEEDIVLVDDVYTSKLSPEARARLKAKHLMFEQIRGHVQNHPEESVNLIRGWFNEDAVR